jgi:hypothetical protein
VTDPRAGDGPALGAEAGGVTVWVFERLGRGRPGDVPPPPGQGRMDGAQERRQGRTHHNSWWPHRTLREAKAAVDGDWNTGLLLTDDEIRAVEGVYSPRTAVVEPDPSDRGRKPGIDTLARAVTRIEREWRL